MPLLLLDEELRLTDDEVLRVLLGRLYDELELLLREVLCGVDELRVLLLREVLPL